MHTSIAHPPILITAAIVACDPSGTIGLKGGLPWKSLEADLKRFKTLTMNSPVIMGRNTIATLPCILKNRYIIELSTTTKEKHNAADILVNSKQQAIACGYLELSKTHAESEPGKARYVWIAGGAQTYRSLWGHLDEIHLTMTHQYFEGDIQVPVFKHLVSGDLPDWELVSFEEFSDNTYYIFKRI